MWKWKLWVRFYLGPNEDYSQGDSISHRSDKLLQRSGWGDGWGREKSVYMGFWWRGSTCNQAHIFCKRFLPSLGAIITMKEFSALLDMRKYKNWAHKISSWKYLSEELFCQFFPEHRVPHFCSPLWNTFSRCWKSSATAAHDLILVAVDGKCQFVADTVVITQIFCKVALYWGKTRGLRKKSVNNT